MTLDNILNQHNKGSRFDFKTPDHFEYINLAQLDNKYPSKKHQVNALYINTKSRYGDAPVAVTDEHIVNLPSHLLDTVKSLMNVNEFVEAVNKQLIGFTIYKYEGTNGAGYSVNWVRLDAF